MSSSTLKVVLSLIISTFTLVTITRAGDPDILTDFIPPTTGPVDANYFTFSGFRVLVQPPSPNPPPFKAIKASMTEFPSLNGQSVSYAALQFQPNSINPPHTHPRSAELLFVVQGSLQVGFVDTTSKLFTQNLSVGDMFIFPKGLVHFQHNADQKVPALAISSFGSANAGTISLPGTLFNTSIDDNVLALAFKTDVTTIQNLKKGFTS